CSDDTDCGKYGKCITFGDQGDPQKQCFCANGYYGQNCDREARSFIRDPEFDASLYKLREVGADQDRIYWRIVEDELEVVLKFKGNSWLGVGWKSTNSAKACPSVSTFSITKNRNYASSNENSIEFDANEFGSKGIFPSLPIEPVDKSKNISTEGNCGANEELAQCPEFTRQCEASCDWTRYPETIPNCPRSCGAPKCVCKEGFVRAANDNDTCVPFHYCSDEVGVECATNSTWAKCGIACEPTCDNMYDTSPCPARCDVPACTCSDNYVRYKDECIFWGDCPNLEQHWATEVTINSSALVTTSTIDDQSTVTEMTSTKSLVPLEALTCGINETINECGRACESDCITIFLRAPCEACSKPACACIQGYARMDDKCIYWGDCPFDVNGFHTTTAVSKLGLTSTPSEIVEDIFSISETSSEAPHISTILVRNDSQPTRASSAKLAQYSSTKEQRPMSNSPHSSSTSTDKDTSVIGDVCYGDWRWPTKCRDCDYRVSWNYLDDTDEIEFSVETRAPSNWWTGIGFSPTGTMIEADMIIVKSRNGELTLHDMYSTSYGPPREDSEQNVYTPTVVGTHVNGVLRAQFTRKRDTGDRKTDHRFSDTACYKFLFPVSGGRLDPNGHITKHISTPQVSANKVCIRSCTAPQAIQPTSSCESEFRYPTGCEGTACDYVAKWEYSVSRKDVRFEISAKEVGRWTGIGFSRDGNMANSDIYTGWVYEGKAYVTDRFAYGRQLPAIDPADRQDIYEISGKIEDDIQTISFRRKVLPADTITDFPLNKCYYFLFPIGGGRVLARKSQDFQNPKTPIGYHDLYQPRVSRTKICICDQNGVPIASEDAPSAVRSRRQVQDPFDVQIDPFVDLPPTSVSDLIEVAPSTTTNETPMQMPSVRVATGVTSFEEETESTAEPVTKPEPEPQPEPRHELEHAMDCSDIVIGQVKDGLSRVRDFYTISRATPRLDSFYGGDDSLTSAVAYEQDGITTLIFRKPLKAKDGADNAIMRGPMTVIWAKGAQSANYVPAAGESVFKDGSAKNSDFFANDLIKYHGANNRGVLTIDFFEGYTFHKGDHRADCSGSFSYPINCIAEQCTYVIIWGSDGKVVTFSLRALAGLDRWTGIGFSLDGSMANSDIIAASVLKDSSVRVIDYFAAGYGRPKIDADQAIFGVGASYDGGFIYANFSRGLISDDDHDLSIDQCVYFLFPVGGGDLEGGTGELRKHSETPISSSKKICLASCARSSNLPTKKVASNEAILEASFLPDESTHAPLATYEVIMRILNREWNPRLSDGTTEEFRSMANEVTEAMSSIVKSKWPNMKVAYVSKFTKGSVIAHVVLTSDDDSSPSANKLKETIEEHAIRGPIDSLQVEPTTIKATKTETELTVFSAEQLRNWIIIAFGVSLFVLAFCLVCCILCGSCKKKNNAFGGYPMQYPMNGYGYQTAVAPQQEKKGFENAAFQSNHLRHFSQATTASQNGKGSPNTTQDSPKGVGETTYQEWYTKVASKPSAQLYQETAMPSPPNRQPSSRQSVIASPYVSYPNEPANYYTLNGEHRAAPPGYYRPY
uniref:DOMON domain-containing protein n=1 Tax=Parascaris univalens TaxID=6257 RepID=A0A915A5V3_PARUN